MTLFLLLLLVHLVADFYIQRKSWIESKIKHKEKSIGLFKHILTHLGLNAVVLYAYLGLTPLFIIALLFIVLSHYAIDIWKTYQGFYLKSFLIDQVAHIAVLALVAAYVAQPDIAKWHVFLSEFTTPAHLVVIAVFLFAWKPISLIIQLLMRPYTNAMNENDNTNKGLPFAGEWIGVLERFLVIAFVMLGQFAGIGFLLAAKSVFRFGDMRREQDRKLTEYIMLGTLFSVSVAFALGLLANQMLATLS
ncbi:DUF3307 domain-containing protein [Glaciecola sp. XM2]|jgi:hypothetical protein|uniref:DUF3307 domain-containing protein n=1 Tax=Glaciecola sp. XM2 TaxID=1914931 RepID=UPI001BDF47B3|nr:DUF3307 domain-containing protein [Glaciecola sp. XM2]MBT1449664.1 DUF3307 domain-containing protein [Glaciecola sp. XM2]